MGKPDDADPTPSHSVSQNNNNNSVAAAKHSPSAGAANLTPIVSSGAKPTKLVLQQRPTQKKKVIKVTRVITKKTIVKSPSMATEKSEAPTTVPATPSMPSDSEANEIQSSDREIESSVELPHTDIDNLISSEESGPSNGNTPAIVSRNDRETDKKMVDSFSDESGFTSASPDTNDIRNAPGR